MPLAVGEAYGCVEMTLVLCGYKELNILTLVTAFGRIVTNENRATTQTWLWDHPQLSPELPLLFECLRY